MPVTLEVKLDPQERRAILNAVNAIEGQVIRQVSTPGLMLDELAKDFVVKVKTAIIIGKYSGTYKSYNKRYETWKRTSYRSPYSFWRLGGDLLKNIQVVRYNDTVFAGVPPFARDKGGKGWKGGFPKPIAMYGSIMEEGRLRPINKEGKHPARPVFEPTFKDYTFSDQNSKQGQMWVIGERTLIKIGEWWKPS
jgi:hypothetical protein